MEKPHGTAVSSGSGGGFWFHLVFTLLGSLLLLFVAAPLLGLFFATSGADLVAAAADPEITAAIGRSLVIAMVATMVCSLLGIPLAYLLARKFFPGKALVLALIDLPVIIPHTAAGIALLAVLGRKTLAGGFLAKFGLAILSSPLGIGLAMAFVSLPFLVNAAREGFLAVPERLEKAARTLGASPWRVFWTISLRMAWRPVLTGMTMMWARGISEFGAVVIIAYHPMTATVKLFSLFNDYGLKQSRPAAVLLVLVCVVIFIVLRLLARTGGKGRTRDA